MGLKLLAGIESHLDRPAVMDVQGSSSYRELRSSYEEWVGRVRASGLPAGSVVALRSGFTLDGISALIALAQERMIVVPLGEMPAPKRAEFESVGQVEYVLDLATSQEIVRTGVRADHELYDRLRRSNHAGLVLFSSGTTGRSKGTVLDFESLMDSHQGVRRSEPRRTMTFLNFDHIGGINTLLHTLSSGGTVVAAGERTSGAVLSLVASAGVQVLPTTPTFLTMCLVSGDLERFDLSSLELVTYGTEPMPEQTLRRACETLPGVRFKQTYGLSELGIMSTKSKDRDSLWLKLGGEGFAHKVVDGVLWVKSDQSMLGYLNAPYSFDAEGFFNTQDRVEVDGDYVRVLGRDSELINVGGLKVYPNEVESTILEVDGVLDVLVAAKPSPVMGNVVQATVLIGNEWPEDQVLDMVRSHCENELEPYKVPVAITPTRTALHSTRFKKARA